MEIAFGPNVMGAREYSAMPCREMPVFLAREDYAEEAWRIVDPVLRAGTSIHEYAQQAWGPQLDDSVTPSGGWHNPVPALRG